MEKLNRITAPAGDKLRQLQKIVSDIKKNETGLLKKIKNIKSKSTPPTVPRRDYQTGPPGGEDDDWFDEFGSDYDSPDEHSDSEPYVVPIEDDNYEPPPNDNHMPPSFKIMVGNNGYADKKNEPMNMHMRQPPKPHEPFPKQPLPPVTSRFPAANKPLPKPMPSPRHQPTSLPPPVFRKPASLPQQGCEDEENYIVPEPENYIEPAKEPLKKPPAVNRQNKPVPPLPGKCPAVQLPETEDQELYVVPEDESTPSPPQRGSQPKITLPSNLDQDEYEVCEEFISPPEPPIKPKPSPSPRNVKPKPPPNIAQKPKLIPTLPQRDLNSNIDRPQVMQRQRIQSAGNELPPVPHKLPFQLPKPHVIPLPKPPEPGTRYMCSPNRQCSPVEQDADVLNKEWYVSSCDRRRAEEALTATCKDGSFLVRRSSGQDSKQPFTLVVFYNRRVYNIPVRYIEATRQYALGREKSGEEKFSSVAEIIENHRQFPLVLIDSHNNTKDSTKLKQAVRIP
ncbi:B-cell linker protein isoform X2 [Eleutherodactylus coqui]|uniref:SH2 domain-containing protein n=1 Tax=Eleutherodactylus coqui TaxID=57060 RepID=A0A8J6FDJ5_ELECQ|nr:hypothetical protein GDO78_008087 [Eleutherodactylus coqui]